MASIEEQLNMISLQYARVDDGRTIAEVLKDEVNRLYHCIQKYIDAWYDKYNPQVYERTYRLQGALYAEDLADIRVDKKTLTLSVCVHDDLDYHKNLSEVRWTDIHEYNGYWLEDRIIPIKDEHETSTLLTMNYGWYAPKLEWLIGRRVDGLTHFSGVGFIEDGIAEWNQTNKFGIKIKFDKLRSRNLYR